MTGHTASGAGGARNWSQHYKQNLLDQNRRMREALRALLDHYTQLINSGDAGNWDPEKEPVVIAAREALADETVPKCLP